ncbi:MAG: hypothetical protein RL173_3432 [Fibrobacterota bacterium]|jgi:flagellar basal body-associated protein FliL
MESNLHGPGRCIFRNMKFGRIVGVLVILLALAGIGAGAWYWSTHNSNATSAPSLPNTESDSALVSRTSVLSDSLQALDMAIRNAQLSDSEPPVELIQRQNEMWSRYTWAKSRLSDVVDARVDTAGKASAEKPGVALSEMTAGLGDALGSLAIYLWILAGVATLAVVVLAWWILGRRPKESHAPLTEPTMTRVDRNVRMPVPGAPAGRNLPAPREATFSQMRAAARLSSEMDDEVAYRPGGRAVRETDPEEPEIPAAPLPKTGRHAWENTTSQPANNLPSPSEPTVVQDYVVSMAKRGRTSSEIARRLRIPQDQVDLILKLRRNG